MNSVHGMRIWTTVALAARDAAWRFVSRGAAARTPGEGWRPISLRWRRQYRRSDDLRAVGAVPTAKTLWFPQFHLHFSTNVNDRFQRDSSPTVQPLTVIHQAPIILHRRSTSIRCDTHAPQPSRGSHALPDFHADKRSLVRFYASHSTVFRPCWLPIASRLEFGTRPSLSEGSRRTARVVRSEQTQSIEVFRQIRLYHSRPSRHFPVAIGTALSHPRNGSAPSKGQHIPPPELVWRRVQQSLMEKSQRALLTELPRQSDRPGAPPFQAQETGPEAASFPSRGSAVGMTTLDPGMMDRLTDDVIRRVERRVRIERERRGI